MFGACLSSQHKVTPIYMAADIKNHVARLLIDHWLFRLVSLNYKNLKKRRTQTVLCSVNWGGGGGAGYLSRLKLRKIGGILVYN